MINYYIDPENGDNANDGLTASLAKESFIGITGTESDPAIIYIRRGTSHDMSEEHIIMWSSIISWPNSDSTHYTGRPTSGIDAGWDSDISDVAKITDSYLGTNGCFNIVEGNGNEMYFYDIDFIMEAITDNTFLYMKKEESSVIFDRCRFYMENSVRNSFFYTRGTVESTIISYLTFNDCEIYEYEQSFLSHFYQNRLIMDIEFNRCNIVNTNRGDVTFMYISLTSRAVSFTDCTVNIKNIFVTDGGNHNSGATLSVNRCDINISNKEAFFSSTPRHINMPRLYILDSNISTPNASAVSSINGNSAFADTLIENCTIQNSKGFMSSSMQESYSRIELIIKNTVFRDISAPILNVTANGFEPREYIYNRFVNISDDCIFENCDCLYSDNFIYKSNSLGIEISANISNASFTSMLRGKANIGTLIVKDSNIGAVSANGGILDADFCVVGAVCGFKFAKIKRSTIESSIVPVFSDVTIEVSDSIIVGQDIFDKNTVGKIVSSAITGSLSKNIEETISVDIFDSRIDDILLPYAKGNNKSSKVSSPEYRIGGAGSSIKTVSFANAKNMSIDEFYTKSISGTTILLVYIATSSDIFDRLSGKLKCATSNGYRSISNSLKDIDNSSQWDGIPVQSNTYYFEFDVSTLDVTEGSLIEVSILLEDGPAVTVWADPLIIQQ